MKTDAFLEGLRLKRDNGLAHSVERWIAEHPEEHQEVLTARDGRAEDITAIRSWARDVVERDRREGYGSGLDLSTPVGRMVAEGYNRLVMAQGCRRKLIVLPPLRN